MRHVYNERENNFFVKVAFGDEIEAVQKEAKSLREQGVEIIIALGHSGYDIDQVRLTALTYKTMFNFVQSEESESIGSTVKCWNFHFLSDQELARSVPELDLVVGGHSHTFLYT